MITFTLPTEPPRSKNEPEVCCGESVERDPYEYIRRVTIPANDKILKECPVGTEVEVILKGKVTSAEDDTHYDGEQIRVKISEVKIDPGANEFTELAEDE